MTWRVLNWDTETHRFAPGRMAPRMVCQSYAWLQDRPPVLEDAHVCLREEGVARLRDTFRDPEVIHVGHNLAYDMGVAAEAFPDREEGLRLVFQVYAENRGICTQVQEQLLDIATGTLRENGGYPLARLAAARGIELDKDPRVRLGYDRWDGVPVSEWDPAFRLYARTDAYATASVFWGQAERAARMGYLDARGFGAVHGAAMISRKAWALHLLSVYGIAVDPVAVASLRDTLHQQLFTSEEGPSITEVLRAAGLLTPKGKVAQKKLQDAVVADYQARGLDPPRGQPTERMLVKDPDAEGNVQFSADALAACTTPALRVFTRFNHLKKLLTTYLPVVEAAAATGRCISARFNPLVATGRSSCGGPNLQNLPQEAGVRQCYVPRPGYVFDSCDYAVEELRTWAQVCHSWGIHSEMRQAFIRKEDPHLILGAKVARMQTAELLAFKKGTPEQRAVFKQYRGRIAKAGNFGFPGALGAAGFVDYARGYEADLNLEQSTQVRNDWFATWPEGRQYFKRMQEYKNEITERYNITQLFSGRRRGNCFFPAACNSMFQGLTADGSGEALFWVQYECWLDRRSDLYGSRPVAYIHDEILAEHPEEYAAEAAARLERVMVDVMQPWTPNVPQAAEATLMRRWDKAAEPVFNDTGRLIPFDD